MFVGEALNAASFPFALLSFGTIFGRTADTSVIFGTFFGGTGVCLAVLICKTDDTSTRLAVLAFDAAIWAIFAPSHTQGYIAAATYVYY